MKESPNKLGLATHLQSGKKGWPKVTASRVNMAVRDLKRGLGRTPAPARWLVMMFSGADEMETTATQVDEDDSEDDDGQALDEDEDEEPRKEGGGEGGGGGDGLSA